MEDKKRDAAEVGTICDTKPNESINIIAHELNKGKTAVYLKRDGWTMMPQLPTESGEYLVLTWTHYKDRAWVFMTILTVYNYPDRLQFGPTWDRVVAWRKVPKIPKWAQKLADEQAAEDPEWTQKIAEEAAADND